MVVVLPSELAVVGVWAEALGCGCHCYLPVHGPALGPADSQLLKVCLTEGLGSSSSLGTSQSLVSVLNFPGQSGRRLVVKREEGGGVQGDGSFVLCELCLLSLFRHIFVKTLSDFTGGNHLFLKTRHVTCWPRCHPDQIQHN